MQTAERLSRSKVAQLLGVTVQMVYALEKFGKLHAERVDGRVWYSAAEVQAFAQTYKPDPNARRHKPRQRPEERTTAPIAAKVMACFKKGLSLADTVIATEAHPAFVRRCWDEYTRPLENAEARRQREQAEHDVRELERDRRDRERWSRRIELEKIRVRGRR